MKQFSYEYDPAQTVIEAIECGEAYEGLPERLVVRDKFTQTANIKTDNRYEGIEVKSNKWIELACEEARISVTAQGGPFGAIILQIDDETNEVIRYWKNHNHVTLWNDPTAHAEVMAIRAACKQLAVFNLGIIKKEEAKLPQKGKTSHCEIYSSAEPCPMCFAAISWANIPVLVFAATSEDTAQPGVDFSDKEISAEMTKSYKNRKIIVRQSTTGNSLASFNLWKSSEKIHY